MLTAFQIRYRKPIPGTLTETLALLEDPIGDWWPGELPEAVTTELDQDFTLLFGGQPDDWAYEFLESEGVAGMAALTQFQDEITQTGMKKLRDLYRPNADTLGYVYVVVRRFIVENPVTTLAQIQQTLGNLPLIRLKPVVDFYEAEDEFLSGALHQGQFWHCPHCQSILNWIDGTPRCERHSVCGRLTSGYRACKPLAPTSNLLRLKPSMVRRVCVPGLPEVELYDWAKNLQTTNSGLVSVTLWPGVDRYDLQLCFADSTSWAIDVKDYADPLNLGRRVSSQSFYNLGQLRWDQGYYVFPQYRVDWNNNYVGLFNRATELPDKIEGISEVDFKNSVILKLAQLIKDA